jgi:Beta-galactosidase
MPPLFHGTAYYPELWPEADIDHDIAEMTRLGINVVRMGEFAWSTMEPNDGEISLAFFERVIDRLHAAGIRTIFCTPTPTPPIWLTHDHPERLHVDVDGRRMIHGSRQHACTNNPDFRRYARRIVEAIARTLGRHPALVAWQTDNEFKCHVAECYCASCRTQWHEWLATRYGTIDQLNELWGTRIWSQSYQRFDQVPPPARTAFLHNASLLTAYRLFTHTKLAEFQAEQLAIIRQHTSAPITHNSEPGFHLDNELLFRDLDFASFDHYPSASDYRRMLFRFDLFRNATRSRRFWVMETSPSHNGCLTEVTQSAHPSAFVGALAASAYAQGAEGFSYWLWRQQRTGCELPHGSILSAWHRPATGYRAAETVDRVRRALEPLLVGRTLRAPAAALTYSDRARHMWSVEPLMSGLERVDGFDYLERVAEWHDLLRANRCPRDLCLPGAPLDSYRLLVTPFVPHLPADFVTRVTQWVKRGGTWIVGPMTNWRTEEHTVNTDAGLGWLESFAGIETTSISPLWKTGTEGDAFGLRAPLRSWGAFFRPTTAKAIGEVVAGDLLGEAFIAEQPHGQGRVVLLGAMPDGAEGRAMLDRLIQHYATAANITFDDETSADVVTSTWLRRDDELQIVVNLGAAPGSITLSRPAIDATTGEPVATGRLELPAHHWRALLHA